MPSLEILEKLAVALGAPLWQLFYGEVKGQETAKDERDRFLGRLRPLLARMGQRSRWQLLHLAYGMAKKEKTTVQVGSDFLAVAKDADPDIPILIAACCQNGYAKLTTSGGAPSFSRSPVC